MTTNINFDDLIPNFGYWAKTYPFYGISFAQLRDFSSPESPPLNRIECESEGMMQTRVMFFASV